jgi:ribosomal protein S18 acetylase RimI-like enzyme
MAHILDNPAWNALISGNKDLSNGNEKAKYFSKDVSPFAAVKEMSYKELQLLYKTVPFDRPVAIISPGEIEIPPPWQILEHMTVHQMVHDHIVEKKTAHNNIVALGIKDVPEMLALTKLTHPGPFFVNTILFGHYEGIFNEGKLVAMAGQRLHPFEFMEISAVCTHPDHTGNNYATTLLLRQIHRMKVQSGVPFLHVRSENLTAIKLYNALGFITRKEMSIYIIKK